MLRLAFMIATGLVGAALLHLVIVLALPYFTGRDAYTRILSYDDVNRFFMLSSTPDASGLANDDPYVKNAVCAFSLEQAPVRLQAEGPVPFWSLSIYDTASNEVFSMNDRTSVDGTVDVVLATPIQMTALRKALPEALGQSILVEVPQTEEGYTVLRTLAPQRSLEEAAQTFLTTASCQPLTAGEAARSD
ncbi:DUF1254 domain-containing protein [Rhizobiaceae bacterium n13]|uniref:DUF1254 domain-containing protein n=1 Tax=Ferirhizobium litorale TaxID=2927786 RepID=A0AAE3QDA0_9HYPH|nr:DUF1254 domain-containing protein [Fererhizobium litorale]MDI7861278.1 DUF1254 domain-containing protein [Fererhizobium litorale]MDI7921425.1 DUF1254 domain-containing protein [Fererhizobium litorale]